MENTHQNICDASTLTKDAHHKNMNNFEFIKNVYNSHNSANISKLLTTWKIIF